MDRRTLIAGIGKAICLGMTIPFIPKLIDTPYIPSIIDNSGVLTLEILEEASNVLRQSYGRPNYYIVNSTSYTTYLG